MNKESGKGDPSNSSLDLQNNPADSNESNRGSLSALEENNVAPFSRKHPSPEPELGDGPAFKKITSPSREPRPSPHNTLAYNQDNASPTRRKARHHALRAEITKLRERLNSLIEDEKALANERKRGDNDETGIVSEEGVEKVNTGKQGLHDSIVGQADETSQQQRDVDVEIAKRCALKEQAIKEIRWLLSLNSKLKRSQRDTKEDLTAKNTKLAEELQRERAERIRTGEDLKEKNEKLQGELEQEKRAPIAVEDDLKQRDVLQPDKLHDATSAGEKSGSQDAVGSAADSDAVDLKHENEQLRSTAEAQTRELATLKAEFERWRGQTLPPKLIGRIKIDRPPRKERTYTLEEIHQHYDTLRPPREPPPTVEQLGIAATEQEKREGRRFARRLRKIQDEQSRARDKDDAEYIAAQKAFEQGNYDAIPLDKALRDFRAENWVMFTRGPTGKIRRAGVYVAQLKRDNINVHVLPYESDSDIPSRETNFENALPALTAQLPELQAEAAKTFLSEEEYTSFMQRSFGPSWKELDLSNKHAETGEWNRIVKTLREDERFRTACQMWAAGEPALNDDRCWPPTFRSLDKTQACTQFTNEEERMDALMDGFPGWKDDKDDLSDDSDDVEEADKVDNGDRQESHANQDDEDNENSNDSLFEGEF